MNMNNEGNGNNIGELNPNEQHQPESTVGIVLSAAQKSVPGQMMRNLLEEMFPWLFSAELFKNSLHRFVSSLRTEPCSTLFYFLLIVFGFVPFLCFFLFIGGAFILSVVWFAVCQAVTVTFAAVVFGGFMIFLIAMCCSIASIFGFIIHILYGWRRLSELVSDVLQAIFTQLSNLISQFCTAKRKKNLLDDKQNE